VPDYRYPTTTWRLAARATVVQLAESVSREGRTFENRFFVIGELDVAAATGASTSTTSTRWTQHGCASTR